MGPTGSGKSTVRSTFSANFQYIEDYNLSLSNVLPVKVDKPWATNWSLSQPKLELSDFPIQSMVIQLFS